MKKVKIEKLKATTIWKYLEEVPDPEIPVISIIELGIVRDVICDEDSCIIIITPTYSGCPAMDMIEVNIKSILQEKGIGKVQIKMTYDPAWTTDWIPQAAKDKLLKFGIAPPVGTTNSKSRLLGIEPVVLCPICKSNHTELISQYGSTACKAMYKCNDCKEPFDYFKCH
jgi:ring-1,2-phenylacetyl-CoA epoxidase subunit PaaD